MSRRTSGDASHPPSDRVSSSAAPSSAAPSSAAPSSSPIAKRTTPIVIACVANKGGVGKTTATLNIGYLLSQELGMRVMLVDCDFQASLTGLIEGESFTTNTSAFWEKHAKSGKRVNIAQVFGEALSRPPRQFTDDGAEAKEVLLTQVQDYENFYYIPGHRTIYKMDHDVEMGFGAERYTMNLPGTVTNMFREIGRRNDIQVILVDLSPSPSGVNKAVLWGADYFCTPYFPEDLSFNALHILGDVLQEGVEMRDEPRLALSSLKGMGKIACSPKFLGAFPQNVDITLPPGFFQQHGMKKPDPLHTAFYRLPNHSQSRELKKASAYLEELVARLKASRLATASMVSLSERLVSRFFSEYTDAQAQGTILIDLAKDVMHPKKSSRSIPGCAPHIEMVKETRDARIKREIHLFEYRRIVSALLNNMEREDLNFLAEKEPSLPRLLSSFDSTLAHTSPLMNLGKALMLRGSSFAGRSRAKRKAPVFAHSTSATFQSPSFSGEDYPTDDVRELMRHYVSTGLHSHSDVVFNHLQLGVHAGHGVAGGNVTIEGLRDNLIASRNALLGAEIRGFYIPVGTGNTRYADASGGGHFVLIYGVRLVTGAFSLSYFDPMGAETDPMLREACNQAFPGSSWNIISSPGVQGYDNNCGPWVVEAVRRLTNDQAAPRPEDSIDIQSVRAAQQALLASLGALAGGSGGASLVGKKRTRGGQIAASSAISAGIFRSPAATSGALVGGSASFPAASSASAEASVSAPKPAR